MITFDKKSYRSLIAHLSLPRCTSESKGHGTPVDTKCRTSVRARERVADQSSGSKKAEQSSEERVESKYVEKEREREREILSLEKN